MFSSWSRTRKQRTRSASRKPTNFRPQLQILEDRITPNAHTWNPSAVSGLWSVAGNWSAGGVPVAGETNVQLTFGSSTQTNLTNDVANLAFAAITFNAGAPAYTLNLNSAGQTAQAGGLTIFDNASTVQTIAGTQPLNLTDTLTVNAASGASLTVSEQLTGSNGLTKTGVGTLTLSGANTFTGQTTVLGGPGYGSGTGASLILANPTGPALQGNVQLGNGTALGAPSILEMGAGNQFGSSTVITFAANGFPSQAVFKLNGFNQTVAGLSSGTDSQNTIENVEGETLGTTSATLTITNNSATTYTYSGTIRDKWTGTSGALLVTCNGTGTQTFSGGAITYTGTTSVNAGRLVLSNTTGYRSSTAIASGATLEAAVTGSWTVAASFDITGTGTLVKSGTGTWVLGASGIQIGIKMSGGGLIDIQAGTVQNNYVRNNWVTNLASVNIAAGAIFDIYCENVQMDALTGAGTLQNGYAPGGVKTVTLGAVGGSGTFSGTVLGTNGNIALTKTGSGTQTLSGGSITYTGATSVATGRLVLSDATGYCSMTNIAAGATLEAAVSGTNAWTAAAAFVITGAGTFVKSGTGTLTLTGATNYIGATSVTTGRLVLANTTGYRSTTNIATGATLEAAVSGTNTWTVAASFDITGTGTLVKSGTGTWVLGANGIQIGIKMSSGGLIDIQAGTVQNNYVRNNWVTNLASVNIAAGAVFDIYSENVQIDALTGAGTLKNGYAPNGVKTVTVGAAGGSGTFSGTILGTNGNIALTKTGSGTETLSGANTYTGTSTINGGTLQVAAGGVINTTSQILVGGTGGATLAITGGSVTTSSNGNALYVGSTGGQPGAVLISSGSLILSGTAASLAIGDNAIGTFTQTGGTVTMNGTGIWFANNPGSSGSQIAISAGTFTSNAILYDGVRGTTSITVSGTAVMTVGTFNIGHPGGNGAGTRTVNLNGGTLQVGSGGIVYGLGPAIFNFNGGTLQAGASSASFWNSNANVTANVLVGGATFDTQGFNVTIGQKLLAGTPSGGLTKIGGGALTLSGASAYTGNTLLQAGTLIVNGSLAGTVIVSAGTLGGSGTVKNITASGSTISPGVGVGTAALTTSGSGPIDSTFNRATFVADVNGAAGDRYTNSAGKVALTGATLSVNTLSSGTIGQTYTLISSPGGITGVFANAPVSGVTYAFGSFFYTVTYTGTSVVLTCANAPTTLHWLGAVDSNWSVAGNWLENTTPVSGDMLVFDTIIPNFVGTAAAFAPSNNIVGLTSMVLQINDSSSAGDFTLSGDALTLAAGGITSMVANGANATINFSVGGGLTLATPVTITGNSSALLIVNSAVDNGGFLLTVSGSGGVVISGSLSGTGGVTKSGTGTLTLAGSTANDFSGLTQVASGTLVLATTGTATAGDLSVSGGATVIDQTSAQINSSAAVTVDGTFTLQANVQETIGSLSGAGTVTFGSTASDLTVGGSSATTFAGAFTGAGSLTRVGSGSLTLSGITPGYSGTITLGSGVLNVTGYYSGSTISVTGGTLAGTGTINRLTATGGTVSPAGAGIGTLTISGGGPSSLNATTYQVDLGGGAGDRIQNNANVLTLTGVNLQVTATSTTSASQVFTILVSAGGFGGTTFAGLPNGIDFLAANGRTYRVAYSATTVTLTDVVATSLAFVQQPGDTEYDNPITPGPSVEVLDQFGTELQSDNGRPIAILIGSNPGGGTLTGTQIVLDTHGLATFAGLSIETLGVGYTLVAASGGVTPGTSRPFSILPGIAVRFSVIGPEAYTVGVPMTFTVTAYDSANHVASTYSGTVHLKCSDGSAGLPGDYTFTAADQGVHTFTVIWTTPGSQTLSATDNTASNITGSLAILVNASIRFTSPPPTATVGVAYGEGLAISGGTGTTTFTVTAGVVPPGLTLSSDGVLSGTPALTGMYSFTVSAVDSCGATAVQTFTLTVQLRNPTRSIIAVGADAGAGPQVSVYDAATGTLLGSFYAFAPTFRGGVRVAVGDVTGDGIPDVICAAGPGGGPLVTVYDGQTFQLIRSFYTLTSTFTGGLYVAAGDVNGDGYADIITSADAHGGPQVTVWDGRTGTFLTSFFAFAPNFTGGVRVAAADVDGDGKADIIAGAGPGALPQVTVFQGLSLRVLLSFFAMPGAGTSGVYVAAGDLTGDHHADIVVGTGTGAVPEAGIYDSSAGVTLRSMCYPNTGALANSTAQSGVRVATTMLRDRAAVLTAGGPTSPSRVDVLDGLTLGELDSFFAFPSSFRSGSFVSG
jgi:autotransporter-associated beta strand protein